MVSVQTQINISTGYELFQNVLKGMIIPIFKGHYKLSHVHIQLSKTYIHTN
jgi:molybdopterin-binding protein